MLKLAFFCHPPGLLSWVYQTLVKCGDHVKPTLARVEAFSTLQ